MPRWLWIQCRNFFASKVCLSWELSPALIPDMIITQVGIVLEDDGTILGICREVYQKIDYAFMVMKGLMGRADCDEHYIFMCSV